MTLIDSIRQNINCYKLAMLKLDNITPINDSHEYIIKESIYFYSCQITILRNQLEKVKELQKEGLLIYA